MTKGIIVILISLTILVSPLYTNKTFATAESHAKYSLKEGENGINGLEEMLKHLNEAINSSNSNITPELKENLVKAIEHINEAVKHTKEAVQSVKDAIGIK